MKLCIKPYRRRFRQPLLTAHGYWQWRQGLLVRLEDRAGRVGLGEIAPIPWFGSETLAEAEAFCRGVSTPITDRPLIPDTLTATQFGLGTAFEQLQTHTPMTSVQNPQPSGLCGLLPTGEPALTAWPILWRQGTRTFKWKIGVAPVIEEIALLETLIQALPAQGRLRLDANGGLNLEEAESWLSVCDRLNASAAMATVEYLEQPLPPSQTELMRQLGQRFRTTIALDESVATVAKLETQYRQGWRGIAVVKPTITGDPNRLRQFWQHYSPQLAFSSAFETGVGRQAALALAAEYTQQVAPLPPLALGFGTLGWFDDDWDTLTPAQLWDNL
ncbi:MAG: o-succinylbenzoate synthase [Leptolyngbyaceae cyanobacterium SM2_5_2]|nr:o-succinylbenzoate synthase [Leptolyngbyaceae cyanobacterium SM2_5_2]